MIEPELLGFKPEYNQLIGEEEIIKENSMIRGARNLS